MDASSLWRFGVFLTCLGLFSLLERRSPGWPAPPGRAAVCRVNLALGVVGALALRLFTMLVPVVALVHLRLEFPGLAGGIERLTGEPATLHPAFGVFLQALAFIGLDFAIYVQHRAFHRWPSLWRWHAVHHSDGHLDATSALRFHPVELLLSWAWKLLVATLLGATPATLLAFEVAVNALALFNHSSLRFSMATEAALARWLITPAVHRLHHRQDQTGPAVNYGFSVPWWDRLHASWRAAPAELRDMPMVGLDTWRSGATMHLLDLLTQKPLKTANKDS